MSNVNKAIILGRVGKDPDTRYLPNGDVVSSLAIATEEKWVDKQTGEQKKQTEWHNITFFRRLAETVEKYVKKGDLLYVEGKIKTTKKEGENGSSTYYTKIVADSMQMLGGRPDKHQDEPKPTDNKANGDAFMDFQDDIPF